MGKMKKHKKSVHGSRSKSKPSKGLVRVTVKWNRSLDPLRQVEMVQVRKRTLRTVQVSSKKYSKKNGLYSVPVDVICPPCQVQVETMKKKHVDALLMPAPGSRRSKRLKSKRLKSKRSKQKRKGGGFKVAEDVDILRTAGGDVVESSTALEEDALCAQLQQQPEEQISEEEEQQEIKVEPLDPDFSQEIDRFIEKLVTPDNLADFGGLGITDLEFDDDLLNTPPSSPFSGSSSSSVVCLNLGEKSPSGAGAVQSGVGADVPFAAEFGVGADVPFAAEFGVGGIALSLLEEDLDVLDLFADPNDTLPLPD